MFTVDINCDMGEGVGNDAFIMPFISSANIACGYHAGDNDTMKHTVELCLEHNVSVGAHPSFFDKENFGRKNQELNSSEIIDLISQQIYIIEKVAKTTGATLHHVKPHGALYNMAANNQTIAASIALAVKNTNDKLILYALSGSKSIQEAKKIGLKTASEVFADRTYQGDGTLTPRSQANALINDVKLSVQQVLQMIMEKSVTSNSGKKIPIMAQTICIHGDGKKAVEFAKAIYDSLKNKDIDIKAI